MLQLVIFILKDEDPLNTPASPVFSATRTRVGSFSSHLPHPHRNHSRLLTQTFVSDSSPRPASADRPVSPDSSLPRRSAFLPLASRKSSLAVRFYRLHGTTGHTQLDLKTYIGQFEGSRAARTKNDFPSWRPRNGLSSPTSADGAAARVSEPFIGRRQRCLPAEHGIVGTTSAGTFAEDKPSLPWMGEWSATD